MAGAAFALGEAQEIAERMEWNARGMRVRVKDRTTEEADWY
jgi:hypothetical protein